MLWFCNVVFIVTLKTFIACCMFKYSEIQRWIPGVLFTCYLSQFICLLPEDPNHHFYFVLFLLNCVFSSDPLWSEITNSLLRHLTKLTHLGPPSHIQDTVDFWLCSSCVWFLHSVGKNLPTATSFLQFQWRNCSVFPHWRLPFAGSGKLFVSWYFSVENTGINGLRALDDGRDRSVWRLCQPEELGWPGTR